MIERKIGVLREELHSLINENADYSEILRISRELDKVIVEFIYSKLKNEDKEGL